MDREELMLLELKTCLNKLELMVGTVRNFEKQLEKIIDINKKSIGFLERKLTDGVNCDKR